jgi:DNA-binding beta-propeller fold protein YncE
VADGEGVAASFHFPYGVAVLADGRAAVAEFQKNGIRLVDSGTGATTTLCGMGGYGFADGVGAAARFYRPYDIAVHPDGRLLVVDCGSHRIRAVAVGAAAVSTYAGTGTEGDADGPALGGATFRFPRSVAVDVAGRVVVTEMVVEEDFDEDSDAEDEDEFLRIRIIDPVHPATVRTLDIGEGAPIFDTFSNIALDHIGNLWIADPSKGVYMITSAATGLGPGHHAWSQIGWTPTARCHRMLCTRPAQQATWTLLLTALRLAHLQNAAGSAAGRTTRHRAQTLENPVLPPELWLLVLRWCLVRELGGR